MSLILPESDQIPVLRPPCETSWFPTKYTPFQDIRLALRIITVKNIRGMIKFNIQYFIISVILLNFNDLIIIPVPAYFFNLDLFSVKCNNVAVI